MKFTLTKKPVEQKNMGIFWGNDSIYFVETLNSAPEQIFKVALTDISTSSLDKGTYIPEGMQAANLIQVTLKQKRITTPEVYLTLPSKDIIFRSFVIPYMQSSEIKGVVEFEASKYIPFSLEELSFCYHALSFTDDGAKRIRIIFVAIKKDAMSVYVNALEQSNLTAILIEPEAVSLIRMLTFKELLKENQTVAVIEREEFSGKIIIVNSGIPQFVREFQLRVPETQNEAVDQNALMTRLFNEIRISLDYFNRQENQLTVEHIILITPHPSEDLAKNLEEDLKISIQSISSSTLLATESDIELGFVNAYGAGLTQDVEILSSFDLSDKKAKRVSLSSSSSKTAANYKILALSALACVAFLGLVFFISSSMTANQKKEIASLENQLGAHKSSSTEILKARNKLLTHRLNNFKSIQIQSDVAYYLTIIPGLLPEGTWIKDLGINYLPIEALRKGRPVKGKTYDVSIKLSGFAYLENINEQFGLINQLLRNLKNDEEFSSLFRGITLETTKIQTINKHKVTFFNISCK